MVFIGLLVVTLFLLRNEYGKGFITYGRVVLASFLIALVASILTAVYTIAIYEMDESYLQDIKYTSIEKMEKQFDKADAKYQEKLTDEQYDSFEQTMKKQKKKAINKVMKRTPMAFAVGNIFNLAFLGVIIGLIAGIFIKKEPTPIQQ